MEVVGTIGAVLGIIDVAARCISFLADIRTRLRETDSNVEFLFSQISTVRTALDQIHHLIDERVHDEKYYQLILNLDTAMQCCNLLISTLDEQLSRLCYSHEDGLEFKNKVKMLLESKGINECQRRLDSQIGALNLVITAYTARTIAQQKHMLEQKEATRVFAQIKDDSSSLMVLCDAASFITRKSKTTTGTSKLSVNFSFDVELLQHRVYKNTLRSLMRRVRARSAIKPVNEATEQSLTVQQLDRTKKIDLLLRKQLIAERDNFRSLLFGTESEKVIQWLDVTNLDNDQRLRYRSVVWSSLINSLEMASTPSDTSPLDTEQIEQLEKVRRDLQANYDSGVISRCIRNAMKWCATQEWIVDRLDTSMKCLITNIDRITADGYIPSDSDIVSLPLQPGTARAPQRTLTETKYNMKELALVILHFRGDILHSLPKTFLTGIDIRAFMFTVDLCSYDQDDPEDGYATVMHREMVKLDRTIDRRRPLKTPVVLLMANLESFATKIAKSPLETYFPDYKGGTDVTAGSDYVLSRFRRIAGDDYFGFIPMSMGHDSEFVRRFFACVQDIVVQNVLSLILL